MIHYIVVDHDHDLYVADCVCGYKSRTYEKHADAIQDGDEHVLAHSHDE
jgi:hypothetical protein